MTDKLYNLVEKMYIEFSEKFNKVDQRFDTLEQRQIKLEMLIENQIVEKIKALYDDRQGIKDSLATIDKKIDKLTEIVEDHEIRIRVLEVRKKKKTV